jgi:hypothetical protein
MALKTSDNENTLDYDFRYNNPYDLWERFEECRGKQRESEKELKKIVNVYERKPYIIKRGGKPRPEPNWGAFKEAVDDFIRFFSTIALDRKIWCRIDTMEGWDKGLDTTWSDEITQAFHKFCLNRWEKREDTVLKAIRDDAMFNKGITMWDSPLDTYPCFVNAEDVFPDTNATTCPSSFDLMFIIKDYTAVELYNIANDPQSKTLGWNKKPIMTALRKSLDSLKKLNTSQGVINRWREGGVPQSQKDQKIRLIFAYIKEYSKAPAGHEREGNQISLLVFPESLTALGLNPDVDKSSLEKAGQLLKRSNYFRFIDYYAKDFEEVIHSWTSSLEHAFYDHKSFAWQIMHPAVYHDKTTNSVMRAVVRGMRNWIKTSSADTRKRISTLNPDDEVVLLNSDDDVANITMRQDINAAFEMLRGAKANIDSFSPSRFQGTQNSPKGYPITKGEAQILGEQLDDSKSTSIKIAINNNHKFVKELYRRFINSVTESDTWEGFQKFKEYLKSKDIPDSAWAMESVVITPRFNKFGGNATSNYATAQGLVQATQLKPASLPEQNAKRDLIASLVGEPNVFEYMDAPMQFDNEMFIVGQENETLDNPYVNPANVPVTPSDNHMVHIKGHLQDYMEKLKVAAQLLSQVQQDQTYRKQFLLERAVDVVLAQDNKGAHITAHFQIMERDESKEMELKSLAETFKGAQAQQDAIQSQVLALQQQESQENSRKNMFDLEYQHKQRMYQLDEQAKHASLNLDAAKKVSQTEHSKVAAEEKQAQKVAHKQQDQELKAAEKQQDLAAKVANNTLDIEKKTIEQQLDVEKQQRKAQNESKKANSSGPSGA